VYTFLEEWVVFLIMALSWLDTCFGISAAWLVVWKPLCLDPSDGVFSLAICGCHTLNFVMLCFWVPSIR